MREGIIKMLNKRIEETFGYKPEELLGKSIEVLVPQQFRSMHSQHHKNYSANSKSRPMGIGLELYGLHKDGHEFPVEISLTPLETEGNMLVSTAIRDVSSLKYAEILHARFGKILEASANEIYLFDVNTLHFTFVNKGAMNNLGYNTEELRELTPIDLKPEYSKETFAALIQPLKQGKKDSIRFTTMHRRKNGSLYPIEVNLQLYIHETPPIFVAIILDITERVRAETARQRALEALLNAQEEERERISRDLHDQVGQSLTAINLGLSTMLETKEPQLKQLKALTAKALEDVRRISHNLGPALLNELGLEAALKHLGRELAEQCDLKVEVLVRLSERLSRNEELVGLPCDSRGSY